MLPCWWHTTLCEATDPLSTSLKGMKAAWRSTSGCTAPTCCLSGSRQNPPFIHSIENSFCWDPDEWGRTSSIQRSIQWIKLRKVAQWIWRSRDITWSEPKKTPIRRQLFICSQKNTDESSLLLDSCPVKLKVKHGPRLANYDYFLLLQTGRQ